jgi:hypothetical protein
MYWFLSFGKWFLVTPDSAPPGPGPSQLKETVLRLGKRFSNHKFIRIEQSFISTPPAGMFNWHQFRLSGLYGLQLLEVPTLTSLLCKFTLSGFGTLEGFRLLQVLTLISLLCVILCLNWHPWLLMYSTTAWVVWSGRLTTPPKADQ